MSAKAVFKAAPVDAVGIDMKLVITQFVLDPGYQEQARGKAEAEPNDVDQRVTEVFSQVANGNEQVVFYHREYFVEIAIRLIPGLRGCSKPLHFFNVSPDAVGHPIASIFVVIMTYLGVQSFFVVHVVLAEMVMGRTCFLAIFLLVFAPRLYAQQFSLRQFTVVDGLPQSQVNMVIEDANGYLWIGTQGGGLARFDGREFTVYTTRDGLLSNIINYIKLDSKQNLWLVHPRGITRFDGNEFRKFQPPVPPYSPRRVRRVFELNDTIFLVNNHGKMGKIYRDSVYYWDNMVNKNKVVLYTHLLPNRDICLYLNDSTFFVKTRKGNFVIDHRKEFNRALNIFNFRSEVWVLTDKGYYSVDFKSREIKKRELNIQNHIIQHDSLHDFFWTRIDHGLVREYNQAGRHVTDTVLRDVNITQVFLDAEGDTWFGSSGNGLYKYFLQDFDRCASRKLGEVTAIEKDKTGISWIGSANRGLWKMDKGKVRTYAMNALDNGVNAIKTAPDGTLWVATSQGLGRYDRKQDGFKWFTREDGLNNTYVNNLDIDDRGRIWFGTNGGGVSYYDGQSFASFLPENGLNGRNISAIRFLPGNKTVYVGSDYGLNAIKDERVSNVALPEFANTIIHSINVYQDSLLLIGSGGAGVIVLNPETRNKKLIDTKEGLPSDFIYFVAADPDNQIWIGTEKGVTRIKLSPQLQIEENLYYGYDNGLAGVETNQNAFYLGRNEKYFGLVDGIYQFNNLSNKNLRTFDLHLTAVEIFYNRFSVHDYTDSVAGFFKIPMAPVLPSDKNHITFRFNRVDKRYPQSVRFKYFLDNFDKTWSETTSTGQATYGNLPPGKYVFKVLATNSQGSWDQEPLQYAFIIKAPFYQTAVFEMLVVVAIVVLVSLYFYVQVRQRFSKVIETERIRQQEQDSLRKEIARDFHDEMGNQLTRIINYVSLMKLKTNGHAPELQNKVEESAKYLYKGTRDFIWSIDPINDELSKLFIHIRDFGEKLFEEKGINFRAFNDVKDVVKVPYGFSREANLIFKEAMTNAFNHSDAKNVSFLVRKSGDEYEMKLQDDGKGFNLESVDKPNGLKNMKTRAERIGASLRMESSETTGTTISLIFKPVKSKKHGINQ